VDFVTVTGFRGFREFRFLGRPHFTHHSANVTFPHFWIPHFTISIPHFTNDVTPRHKGPSPSPWYDVPLNIWSPYYRPQTTIYQITMLTAISRIIAITEW